MREVPMAVALNKRYQDECMIQKIQYHLWLSSNDLLAVGRPIADA